MKKLIKIKSKSGNFLYLNFNMGDTDKIYLVLRGINYVPTDKGSQQAPEHDFADEINKTNNLSSISFDWGPSTKGFKNWKKMTLDSYRMELDDIIKYVIDKLGFSKIIIITTSFSSILGIKALIEKPNLITKVYVRGGIFSTLEPVIMYRYKNKNSFFNKNLIFINKKNNLKKLYNSYKSEFIWDTVIPENIRDRIVLITGADDSFLNLNAIEKFSNEFMITNHIIKNASHLLTNKDPNINESIYNQVKAIIINK